GVEIGRHARADVAELGEERIARGADVRARHLRLGVVLALAERLRALELFFGLDVRRAERRERDVAEELALRDERRIFGVDATAYVEPRRDAFATRLGLGGRGVELLNLGAQHVRLVVERDAQEIVALLEVVEIHLLRLEIRLELHELRVEPLGARRRRAQRRIEVLIDVG